jgi:DNA mismatch endonuclease (patch repair protein)
MAMRSDPLSPEQRSWTMSRVRSADTRPELAVRRVVHALGYRYRLHDRKLPGRPDLVFRARHKVIFVHGCFWHAHQCRAGSKKPKANAEYWRAKLGRNRARDKRVLRELCLEGWSALVVWECELRDRLALESKLTSFLGARADATARAV